MRILVMALIALLGLPVWAQDEFTPGRPGATESAIAVPAGRWQIETEIASFTRADDTEDASSVATTSFRYGLAHGWDVEAIVAPYQSVSVDGEDDVSGFGDVTLRMRRNFVGQDGGPSFALIGYVTLPTAENGLGAADIEGGLIAAGAFDVSENWNLAWTLGLAAVSTEDDDYESAVSGALTLGRSFGERWGGYVELAAGRAESDDDTALSWGAGLTYLLNDETQLDAGFDAGANDAADDLTLFVGWAHRF